MSRIEELNKVLSSLQSESPDVEACALISEDSLMIASPLPQHIEEGRVAGMCATLHNLGSRASSELGLKDLQQVLIRGEEGYAVMVTAALGTMLIVLTNKKAKLGLVFLDMGRAADQIGKIL